MRFRSILGCAALGLCASLYAERRVAAVGTLVGLAMDTRDRTVLAPSSAAELLPFACNNSSDWPRGGVPGAGAAVVRLTAMEASDPSDPTTWTDLLACRTLFAAAVEARVPWDSPRMGRYRADLVASNALVLATAHVDLSLVPGLASAWGTADAATAGPRRLDTRDDAVLSIPDAASLFEIAYTTAADWRAGGVPLARAQFSSAPQASVDADPDESRRIVHACVGEGTRPWLNHGRGLYQLRLEISAAVDSAEPVVLSRLVDVGFAGVTGLTVLVR